MSQPSHTSWNHKENWEHVGWEAHCSVYNATVEVDVWVQFSFNEVCIIQSNSFEFDCNFNQLLLSSDLKDLLRNLLDNLGPWIIRFIDSMSKSIEEFLPTLNILNKLRNILLLTNLLQHPQNGLIGAPMFGPIQRPRSPSNTSININPTRRQMSNSSSRAIQLVFGVKDEEDL
jgi:hypothetical protein